MLAQPWFTDEIADLGSKDAALQTRGVWVIEIAELDSLSRSDVGKIKAFMSRMADRFRPPYGKRPIDSPRQCVFVGSVNHPTYLRDETGGRRFWPVACKAPAIDVDALADARDQLWIGPDAEIAGVAGVQRIEQRQAPVACDDRQREALGKARDCGGRVRRPAAAAEDHDRAFGLG